MINPNVEIATMKRYLDKLRLKREVIELDRMRLYVKIRKLESKYMEMEAQYKRLAGELESVSKCLNEVGQLAWESKIKYEAQYQKCMIKLCRIESFFRSYPVMLAEELKIREQSLRSLSEKLEVLYEEGLQKMQVLQDDIPETVDIVAQFKEMPLISAQSWIKSFAESLFVPKAEYAPITATFGFFAHIPKAAG
ncbi:hypothetical protein V6R21_19120 [Limibacter armeniacum]|uniref:hypothetical protein n=1 Tax=Limibacter armeniacum TaxID=466084 RepID=UPI002FE63E29